ncbi:MAG: ExbD/TolR family protein [Bdellovibrionota bacterium]|jgi:biopolymer transport protein ExbD
MDIAKRPKVAVQLNIAPLIDIVFLLLIFFMLTSTFLKEQAVQLNLPEAESGEVSDTEALRLTATDDNIIMLNGKSFPMSELTQQLVALRSSLADDHPVLLRIDNASQVQLLVAIMESVQEAGFTNFSLATESPSKK